MWNSWLEHSTCAILKQNTENTYTLDNPPVNKHIWWPPHIPKYIISIAIVSINAKSVFRLKPSAAASNSSSNKFCANFKSFAHIVQQQFVRTLSTLSLCMQRITILTTSDRTHFGTYTHTLWHSYISALVQPSTVHRTAAATTFSHDIFFSNKIRMLVSHCPFFGLFKIYSSAQHYLYFNVSTSINLSIFSKNARNSIAWF